MPYKNSEKRKEKSRDAARCRRGKESEIFNELAKTLPVADNVCNLLDKASIMRLTISELKKRAILEVVETSVDSEDDGDQVKPKCWDHLYQKVLEGFSFIVSDDGDIVYLSDSVSRYLGLQQIELIGQSIYEFAHPCDHDELRELLSPKPAAGLPSTVGTSSDGDTHKCDVKDQRSLSSHGGLDYDDKRVMLLRLKCTLTSKGRNVNLKSATYKPLKVTGHLLVKAKGTNEASTSPSSSDSTSTESHMTEGTNQDSDNELDETNTYGNESEEMSTSRSTTGGFPYLVGVAEPIPHPSNIEIPLGSHTFLSKHSMDMRFVYCDERIEELAGFISDDMTGQSIYDYHHGIDSDIIEKAFKDLFSKGQTVTEPYRFLAKHGGYIWIVTEGTVITNSRTQKPQSVVCVHHVISGVEQSDKILSHIQERTAPKTSSLPLEHLPPKIEHSTESIFAPKTKDMEQGYFVPPEMKESITFINEEPADLSYLSPNAGDDFLPVICQENDEMITLKQEPNMSPDMGYRLNASPMSGLGSDTPSRIGSPNEYCGMTLPGETVSMDKFFQAMSPLDSSGACAKGDDAGGDIDFACRAPYIPMDSDQDLGLTPPTPGLLFTFSEDLNPGLYGQTENVFGPKQSAYEEPPQPPKLSIQEMLQGSTAVASIERPADTMYLQMKKPFDMNSLEKGPPTKMMRVDGPGAVLQQAAQPFADPLKEQSQQRSPRNRSVSPMYRVGNLNNQQRSNSTSMLPMFGTTKMIDQQKSPKIGSLSPMFGTTKMVNQQKSPKNGNLSPMFGTNNMFNQQQSPKNGNLSPMFGTNNMGNDQQNPRKRGLSPMYGGKHPVRQGESHGNVGVVKQPRKEQRQQSVLRTQLLQKPIQQQRPTQCPPKGALNQQQIQQELELQRQQRQHILSGISNLVLKKQHQQQGEQAYNKTQSQNKPDSTTHGYNGKERRSSKDSVLLSLLLSGNERNYKNSDNVHNKRQLPDLLQLPYLTSQECEVNAPTSALDLVEGAEILTALEMPNLQPYSAGGVMPRNLNTNA